MSKENILDRSFNKAINGGLSGFTAMSGQVFGLMWMRTIMNYQYRNGGNFTSTFKLLYKEGGIPRFYRGLGFALMQAPLSRFGDTAMNVGILELTKDSDLPIWLRTGMASAGASSWRLFLMPIDSFKTTLQVHGSQGFSVLKNKVKTNGPKTLWNGSGAAMSATFVGHYPWFMTYNYLNN